VARGSLSTFPVGEPFTLRDDCSPELPTQAVHEPESFPGGCSFGVTQLLSDLLDHSDVE
jgi:hypothetical protein